VYGDSVMYELDEQFRAAGAADGVDVQVRAAPGCTSSTEARDQNNLFSRELCATIRDGLRVDVDRFRPDAVLLYLGGTWDPFVWHGAPLDPCSDVGEQAITDGVVALVRDVAVADNPVFVVVPPRMADAYAEDAPAAPCYARAYRRAAVAAGAHLLDIAPLVCAVDADHCDEPVNGITMRRDGLHFSAQGGNWAIAWLLEQIRSALAGADQVS
jgi:lysophospholipase L1-like esterase